MSDKTREEFEEKLPKPEGVFWNTYCEQYDGSSPAYFDCAEIYHNRFETWLEAKEKYEPKWISVNDQLPEDGQHVAFIADIPNISRHHYLTGKAFGGVYRGGEFPDFSCPGHCMGASYWMPLPERAQRTEQ